MGMPVVFTVSSSISEFSRASVIHMNEYFFNCYVFIEGISFNEFNAFAHFLQ